MDFQTAMRISSSGLSASRTWISVTSANLANAYTTRTASGEPYRRRVVIYESEPVSEEFPGALEAAQEGEIDAVKVVDIVPDNRDFIVIYDPDHPDADKDGMVKMPNINTAEEMANLISASRAYEANLAALSVAKHLALKALDIGK